MSYTSKQEFKRDELEVELRHVATGLPPGAFESAMVHAGQPADCHDDAHEGAAAE